MGIIKIKFLLAENGDSILVKLGNPVETSFFIDGGTINTYSLLKDELSKLYPICTGSYIFEHIITIIALLEELRLIYLYTNTDIDKDYILMNDQYFNINTANRKFSEEAINAIWDIDKAKLTEDYHIETKYGIGVLRNLSSGCKSYLNIIFNSDKIVSVMECGANVLDRIFMLDNIRIYMSHPERFRINDDVQICFNEDEIVKGRHGYESWWSQEYERREKNDIQ